MIRSDIIERLTGAGFLVTQEAVLLCLDSNGTSAVVDEVIKNTDGRTVVVTGDRIRTAIEAVAQSQRNAIRPLELMVLSGEPMSTPKLCELSGMPVSALRPKLDELLILGICEISSDQPPGMETSFYDSRANHYWIHPDWLPTVEIYKCVIRVGGRIRENSIGKLEKEAQNESIHPTPPNRTSISRGDTGQLDHSQTVSAIRDVILARRDTNGSRGYFISLVSATVRQQHEQLNARDIEQEIEHLNESDPEIQAIIAQHTEA
jgi:hypothetical protein